jgi:hypothetical protein
MRTLIVDDEPRSAIALMSLHDVGRAVGPRGRGLEA